MRLLALLAIVFVLGCGPLYRVGTLDEVAPEQPEEVESKAKYGKDAKYQQKDEDKDEPWKTLSVYMLPRTDLRVDAEVAMSMVSHGQHYCFGKSLGMGEGRVGQGRCRTTCLPGETVYPLVRKLEVTPITVPDVSEQYAFQIRNIRRAAKRTAEFLTTSTALISGPEATGEAPPAGIAFGAFKAPPRSVSGTFSAFHDPRDARAQPTSGASDATAQSPGEDKCQDIAASAIRAADEYKVKVSCLRRLGETAGAMSLPWEAWSRFPQCREVATIFGDEFENRTGGEAADTLGPRVEYIRNGFRIKRASATYSVQKWIRVEDEPDSGEVGVGHPVGLCKGEGMTVSVCGERSKQLVILRLRPIAGVQQSGAGPAAYGARQISSEPVSGDGLRYRLPRTLLLDVELRLATDAGRAEESGDVEEFRSRRVRPVTFPQLGPILRAPDHIRGGPAGIRMTVSKETGMLTSVRVSLEPVMRKKDGQGTLKTVQTVTYERPSEQGAAAQASKLEQDKRLLQVQREYDRARGLPDSDDPEAQK